MDRKAEHLREVRLLRWDRVVGLSKGIKQLVKSRWYKEGGPGSICKEHVDNKLGFENLFQIVINFRVEDEKKSLETVDVTDADVLARGIEEKAIDSSLVSSLMSLRGT